MNNKSESNNTASADTCRPSLTTGSADPYMEEICDKIRHGEPVGFMDALAAIEYQRQRKLQEPPPFWKRAIRFFLPNSQDQARGE